MRDQATFVVARKTWEKLVGFWNNGIISNRPAEGDWVYLPLSKSLFEIKFVDNRTPFYQLSNLPIYRLQCELVEYSNEKIDTGITELDRMEQQFATEYVFTLSNSNGTQFDIGENVTQILVPAAGGTPASTISAQILRFEEIATAGQINIYLGLITTNNKQYGEFQITSGNVGKLIGQQSGAAWDIIKTYTIATTSADKTFVNSNQQAQNYNFEQAGNSIIDFTEKNPFGEVSISE
jgi:hypothetical protein